MHANGASSLAGNRATARWRRPEKKTIYRMAREENGTNKTTFTPADLHDDQVGGDTYSSRQFAAWLRIHFEPWPHKRIVE